jgi:hypothetical protein
MKNFLNRFNYNDDDDDDGAKIKSTSSLKILFMTFKMLIFKIRFKNLKNYFFLSIRFELNWSGV